MTASSLGRSAMDTHLIEHIIKIAEEKSITKAAEKLYLTQSALNQQLLKLERELGIPLFRRAKTEMIPTQAGEIYLKGARYKRNLLAVCLWKSYSDMRSSAG